MVGATLLLKHAILDTFSHCVVGSSWVNAEPGNNQRKTAQGESHRVVARHGKQRNCRSHRFDNHQPKPVQLNCIWFAEALIGDTLVEVLLELRAHPEAHGACSWADIEVDPSETNVGLTPICLEFLIGLVSVCAMRNGPASTLGAPTVLLPVSVDLDFTFAVLGRRKLVLQLTIPVGASLVVSIVIVETGLAAPIVELGLGAITGPVSLLATVVAGVV